MVFDGEMLECIEKLRRGIGPTHKLAIRIVDSLTDCLAGVAARLTDAEKTVATLNSKLENARLEAQRVQVPTRTRLPAERQGVIRRWRLTKPPRPHVCPKCSHRWEDTDEQKVYANVGLYPDGTPGEVFIIADRAGSTARGALDAAAMFLSIGLQYGVPLTVYLDKVVGSRYGAGGFTGDKDYPQTGSVLDLIARWMRDRWCKEPTDA